jgi:hypothetical protein
MKLKIGILMAFLVPLLIWATRWHVVDFIIGVCVNEEVRQFYGGGTKKAVVYRRNCGATTGYLTNISIVDKDWDGHPVGPGNVFRMLWFGEPTLVEPNVTPTGVELRWESPNRLEVRFDYRGSPGLRVEQMAGVDITYVPARLSN